jgi:bifunctional DNase/RNase
MTHDPLHNVSDDLQAAVGKVAACHLTATRFDALIPVRTATGPGAIDARPSDAIALALRTRGPMLVEVRRR